MTQQELQDLRACCCQATARLQVLREAMSEVEWYAFCEERPQALGWFDADGVPILRGQKWRSHDGR